MNREEFLRQLREALEGKVPERVINENTAYYRDYINNQVKSGMSEKEVLRGLGDPRLLARTIEESCKFAKGMDARADYGDRRYTYEAYDSAEREEADYESASPYARQKIMTMPLWLAIFIALIIMALIIVAAFQIAVFLLPIILAAAIVFAVYRLVKEIWK